MDRDDCWMKTTFFQIVALPRSMTAWIATMFELCPRCKAYHELIATDDQWNQTLLQAAQRYQFVGDVTTYGFLPNATIHGGPKVLIDQSWQESARRSAKALKAEIDPAWMEAVHKAQSEWGKRHDALVVPYGRLLEMETLSQIWVHCLGMNEPFPEDKVRSLTQMNVQRQNAHEVFEVNRMLAKFERLR